MELDTFLKIVLKRGGNAAPRLWKSLCSLMMQILYININYSSNSSQQEKKMACPELTVPWQTNSKCKEPLWDKAPALCNISAPLLYSLSPYKIPPPFNLNITYFQRFLRKNWHVALTSVRWFHNKSRLCSLSIQQHQLACAGDLSRNDHLPNSKDHFAALQPSTLSNYTSTATLSNQILRL